MKLSELFPRKYVSGDDLAGKAWPLTITRVAEEEMRVRAGAAPEKKHVVYFEQTEKGVILSRTLAYQIAEAVGSDDTNDWPGKKIVVYPESVMVAGVHRVGIRARTPGAAAML